MDLLKQLEIKLQALVAQRNVLKDERERAKAAQAACEAEVLQLQSRIEDMQSENAAMVTEREDVRQTVESILKQFEALN